MKKSSKVLKTITISEVQYGYSEEIEECLHGKTFYLVNVEVQEDDQTEGTFETLTEAEKYASDVAKRPLKPLDFNNAILGMR
jgi:hypothetical protein